MKNGQSKCSVFVYLERLRQPENARTLWISIQCTLDNFILTLNSLVGPGSDPGPPREIGALHGARWEKDKIQRSALPRIEWAKTCLFRVFIQHALPLMFNSSSGWCALPDFFNIDIWDKSITKRWIMIKGKQETIWVTGYFLEFIAFIVQRDWQIAAIFLAKPPSN